MSNLTENHNLLSPNGFKLVINRNILSNLEYFATSLSLPSVSQGEVGTNSKQYRSYLHGDLQYGDLSVRVAIDEDMKVYKEVSEWIKQQQIESEPITYDATLIILTSHNNPNQSIRFKNLFPISVGALDFSTQVSDIEYMQAEISFRYDSFDFV